MLRQLTQLFDYAREQLFGWDSPPAGRSVGEHYAARSLEMIRHGIRHSTLGGELKRGGRFGISGHKDFELLMRLGLAPEDVVVDYGCGTLRVGIHLIRHLAPGRYWGLDLDERMLDLGRRLVGEDLLRDKAPELRVIDSRTLAEAAAARPRFLVSRAVMIHVPPEELGDYLGKIAGLIGTGARAIVFARVGERGFRVHRHLWIHAFSTVVARVRDLGLEIEVLSSVAGRGRFRRFRYETLLLSRSRSG